MRCLAPILVLPILVTASLAQEPAKQFTNQIARCKEAAEANQSELLNLTSLAAQAPAFTRGDVSLITKRITEATETWNAASSAFQKGNEQEANALLKKAEELDRNRDRWGQRLYARMRQAQINEYLPATTETYDFLVYGGKHRDAASGEALIEAKKARSEACGRLADAITPTADQKNIDALTDDVFTAETEVQIAMNRWNWANEDLQIMLWHTADKTVTSPELTAALDRIAQWRKDYEATYRQLRASELAIERLKRSGASLQTQRIQAYKVAKEARDRAATPKK